MSGHSGTSHKELAAKLKKLGAVNYDLRKPLTPGQKSNITKKAHLLKDVIERPGTFFRLKTDKKTIRNAHTAEYLTSKDSIFVKRKPFYKSASIKNGVMKIVEIQGDGSTQLTYQIYLPGSKAFYKESERLSKLPKTANQFLTLKIGGASPFRRTFNSTGDLLNYLSSFKLKDGKAWEEILPEIAIVTIKHTIGF